MKPLISILIPAYNEGPGLSELYRRVRQVMDRLSAFDFELLFVNDGSKDDTLEKIRALRDSDPRVCYVDLSRNFGKEVAMAAGFDHVNPVADAVIIMDADLQHPPEAIEEMIHAWQEGYDDIYGRRRSREKESWLRKAASRTYYKLLTKMTRLPVQADVGDFRLLSRRALDSLRQLRETQRYTKGLFSLIGHRKKELLYDCDERFAGVTKWNYFSLFNLAIEGFTTFTTAPLRLMALLGLGVVAVSFLIMIKVVVKALLYGDPVAGYPSLMTMVLFLGGVQLLSIGVIGEYIGRIYWETKNRPLYFVHDFQGNNRPGGQPPAR